MLAQLNSAPIYIAFPIFVPSFHIIIVPTETEVLVKWLSYTLCLVRTEMVRWAKKYTETKKEERERERLHSPLLIHSCPARGAARRWAGGRARVLLKGPSISGRICRQYILPQHNRERRPLRAACAIHFTRCKDHLFLLRLRCGGPEENTFIY